MTEERIVTPEKTTRDETISDDARLALADMVELQVYIVAQPKAAPWHMAPRTWKAIPGRREAHCNPVPSSAAMELLEHRFIEPSSTFTFVVSTIGQAFYERAIKADSK